MLTKQMVEDRINEPGYIQDIGQIDAETLKALARAVRKGILIKTREPWLGYMPSLKTTYRRGG